MLLGNSRRLVTLRTVKDIRPIPGADAIEVAQIDGWEVVVKKGEFCVGDPALYFEIDSFLPATDPRFHFLTSKGTKDFGGAKGSVLKTVRLRGQISQGLALPVHAFEGEIAEHRATGKPLDEIMGIVKYEKPLDICLAGEAEGTFPSFLIKTDLERIQNMDLSRIPEQPYDVSLKMDGSSMTVYLAGDHIGVCSHNLEWRDNGKNTYWEVAKRLQLPDLLREYKDRSGRSIALQGELVGPKIQGNPHYLTQVDFYVYDAIDLEFSQRQTPKKTTSIINSLNNWKKAGEARIKQVPSMGTLSAEAVRSLGVDTLLSQANGLGYGSEFREGVVFKGLENPGIRWKVISNEYLLKGHGSPKGNRGSFDAGHMTLTTADETHVVSAFQER